MRIYPGLSVIVFAASALPAAAQVCDFIDDEKLFLAELGPMQQSLDFDSASPGPINGDEFAGDGFIFDSPLAQPNGQLEVIDGEDVFFWDSNFLNIDNIPFSPPPDFSDSLDITIVGLTWRAIGIEVIDGPLLAPPDEGVEVFDLDGNSICTGPPQAARYLGILSPVPIGRVEITELLNDNDDIAYDNFVLGVPLDVIFADGFESGDTTIWSSTTP